MSRPFADGSTADEVVVLRCIAGHRPGHPLSDDDRSEVTRRMAARGFSDGQIAHALGIHRRSVTRIRTKLRVSPGVPFGSNAEAVVHNFPSRHRDLG